MAKESSRLYGDECDSWPAAAAIRDQTDPVGVHDVGQGRRRSIAEDDLYAGCAEIVPRYGI
jgi:hypothetical protein